MDYIFKKFSASVNMTKPEQTARFNFLKARIEYVFYLLLGFTWNKYKDEIELSELISFANQLSKDLTLGRIIEYIHKFDKAGNVLNADTSEIMTKYNKLRIKDLAHGFTFNNTLDVEKELESIYTSLCECTPLLKNEADIIVVTQKNEDSWEGYCLSSKSQFPEVWNCPVSVLKSCTLPCVLYRFYDLSNDYFQLSPFIHLKKDIGTNVEFFMFFNCKNISTGEAEYTNMFADGKERIETPHLKELIKVEKYRKISSQGTVINLFKTNYKKYVDVGVRETVESFVKKNKANVTAVLSGNGGVGKTACAQKVCMDLFDDKKHPFKYIIFASAKDRRFDEKTGKIEEIPLSLKNYYDVIDTIYRTIKNEEPDFSGENSESFKKFVNSFCEWNSEEKILLVVDDFETFDDEEKEKIAYFLGRLDTHKHKVIVTTRNRALIDGFKIQTDSFSEEGTVKFIKAKIEEMYPAQIEYFNELVEKEENIKHIHTITDGVPIFMIQWIHLYAQKHEKALWESNLSSREEARNFLVGRVYNYFNQDAKILYAALSQIAYKGNLFDRDMLKSVCERSIGFNAFDGALDELEKMNVVQKYGNSQNTYLVYNDSFLDDMKERFSSLKEQTRRSISNKLNQNYGGRVISSPYDSLLAEAKSAYNRGALTTAESTYRQVIKNPDFPSEKRVEALVQLIMMLTTNERYKDAIAAFNEYKEYSDNPKVIERYIWALWGCTVDEQKNYCQRKVFEFLENYFSKCKMVDSENLSAFALGSTFYSKYTLSHTKDSTDKSYVAFDCCYKVYKYVQSLSDEEFEKQILEQRPVKQNTNTALIQGIDISAKLCSEDDSYKDKMLEIARFYFIRYPNISTNHKHILNILNKQGVEKSAVLDFPEGKTMHEDGFSSQLYSFVYSNSKINSESGNIWGFVGTVTFDGVPTKALLHVKEWTSKFITPEEKLAFEDYLKDGNIIKVKIKQTERGLVASLIGVSPSFDDFVRFSSDNS